MHWIVFQEVHELVDLHAWVVDGCDGDLFAGGLKRWAESEFADSAESINSNASDWHINYFL